VNLKPSRSIAGKASLVVSSLAFYFSFYNLAALIAALIKAAGECISRDGLDVETPSAAMLDRILARTTIYLNTPMTAERRGGLATVIIACSLGAFRSLGWRARMILARDGFVLFADGSTDAAGLHLCNGDG
jgi:hypothetical protein